MSKAKRPEITTGSTIKVATGCGNAYITCNVGQDGRPIEVFGSLGKAGGCAKCQSEALTRCITLGLKYGVPLEEYIDQLFNLGCPSPSNDSELGEIRSCPDALSKVMKMVWIPKK